MSYRRLDRGQIGVRKGADRGQTGAHLHPRNEGQCARCHALPRDQVLRYDAARVPLHHQFADPHAVGHLVDDVY